MGLLYLFMVILEAIAPSLILLSAYELSLAAWHRQRPGKAISHLFLAGLFLFFGLNILLEGGGEELGGPTKILTWIFAIATIFVIVLTGKSRSKRYQS